MSVKFTILGCGSSGGVPRIGPHWGACDPENPRNRRRRCSLLVEQQGEDGSTTLLVDTSPDMREQLLDAEVSTLDAVLFTHDHADHIHGIDDLRMPIYNAQKRIDAYMDEVTRRSLETRFGYCFVQPQGSSYPPILNAHDMSPLVSLTIEGAGGAIEAMPLPQIHGDINSLGFRFGKLAYSPDVSNIPDETLPHLQDLDVWIIDALRYTNHPSHFSVEQSLQWIERIKPKRAILTHLHVDLDYETLRKELPDGIEPAFDGLVVEL